MVLDKIKQPNDIKNLSEEEINALPAEIREFLIDHLSKTGGHLASNLGTVELTIALHLLMDFPKDKLIWDVGHQAYTHKILTGRADEFEHLRQYGGISGFPKREEKQNLELVSWDTEIFYPKTHDLDTSCGFVYMVHEDLDVLQKDIEFLRRVEMDAFSLVLSNEELEYEPIDDEKIARDIKKIVKAIEDYGTGLLITDQFIDDAEIIQTGIKDIDRLNGEFDYVIINLNKSMIGHTDDISVDIILSILSNIRVGGLVCVPKTTYEYFPSKRKGIEALIKTLNLRIEVPPHGLDVGIVASRESF